MKHYDVFNGDADGIIALLQLRWAEPRDAELITGVKRDINLLTRVPADAGSVTVLDISMEKNIGALSSLLAKGVPVVYFDHHRSGQIPDSLLLDATIDLAAEICTALLVDKALDGRFAHWAIAGAFGDNLLRVARDKAAQCGLDEAQTAFLQELGTLINYNGYGATLADLHIAPGDLFRALQAYPDPFALLDDPASPYYVLKAGYESDLQNVAGCQPTYQSRTACVYMLPAQPWARRISGVFGNALANDEPNKAHAVLIENPSLDDAVAQTYTVSVRAPLAARTGADEVCCQFVTGGGRQAAAGINALPFDQYDAFVDTLDKFYQQLR